MDSVERKCIRCNVKPAAPRRKHCYGCKTALYREQHPVRSSYTKDYRERLKREVVNLYGGACACCGETELVFLTFDHVEPIGKGRLTGSTRILHDAKKRHGDGFYQVLCFNCNFAKHWGGCPHKAELTGSQTPS